MKTPSEYREMEFIELFIALARLYKPQFYVELGVKKGYTLRRMAPFVKRAVGVDIVLPEIDEKEYPNVRLIGSTTEAYARTLLGLEPFIDMLFIDADHSYQAVKRDFSDFLPFVKPGTGLILMHDTHPIKEELIADGYCSDAWKMADEIHQSYPFRKYCEIVTLPGPWAGLSIVRRLSYHHLSWFQENK